MAKGILEKLQAGEEVSIDEIKRSANQHMSGYMKMLTTFENDIRSFETNETESFKSICENDMMAAQTKQLKAEEITNAFIERLNDETDKEQIKEIREKRDALTARIEACKVKLSELLIKFKNEKAKSEKETLEAKEVVRGTSAVVTSEVKVQKLSLDKNVAEFSRWCEQVNPIYGACFYNLILADGGGYPPTYLKLTF